MLIAFSPYLKLPFAVYLLMPVTLAKKTLLFKANRLFSSFGLRFAGNK